MPKRAVLKVTPEALASIVSILEDAEIDVIGLVIEGDALPDECSSGLQEVYANVSTQFYGKQRITRVDGFKLSA